MNNEIYTKYYGCTFCSMCIFGLLDIAIYYIYGLMCHTIDDEKVNKARVRMAQLLDTTVTSAVASDNPNGQYAILLFCKLNYAPFCKLFEGDLLQMI